MYYSIFKSPFCDITLVGSNSGLTHLHLDTGKGKRKFTLSSDCIRKDNLFQNHKKQLADYFSGKRKRFDLLLDPEGTDFQKTVWKALYDIPFGKLRSYKEIAAAIGNPNAYRAVGMANSKNPIPLIIPCHRVIGANGTMTGFAYGKEMKSRLIDFEQSYSGNKCL